MWHATVCNFTVIKLWKITHLFCIFSGLKIEISVEDSKTGVWGTLIDAPSHHARSSLDFSCVLPSCLGTLAQLTFKYFLLKSEIHKLVKSPEDQCFCLFCLSKSKLTSHIYLRMYLFGYLGSLFTLVKVLIRRQSESNRKCMYSVDRQWRLDRSIPF